ncbi:hypothetical protein [Rubrimonas cliftonensis]|uniref:Uncharacterized protein n=1 Tax=Rubrimonas cliftonensis TaxID=89524 RepID=A0A1H4CXZ1_9RHOB|nr:hypothetical protein [Rubrimonas cliftonensis]SEA65257.1 hypothetical protein SAMN05444370_108103 [Rubrimonas cliftonensis]
MTAPAIRRIVFTGDFLRPSPYRWRPTQHYNIRWLRQLLGAPLGLATRLPIETVVWGRGSVASEGVDGAAAALIYDAFGLPRSSDGWARLSTAAAVPDLVETFIHGLFRDALVIGFETPPMLEGCLRRAGVPHIDVINHPVRFLDDIFLGFRSDLAPVRAALARHAVREDRLRLMAGVQAAAAQRLFEKALEPRSLLFLMQVADDRSQIRDGAFVGATDYLEEIAALARGFSRVYVKEHPLQPRSPHSRAILARCPNAETAVENFYSLVATDQIAAVASLSSSATLEAGYFGKAAHYLLGAPYALAPDGRAPAPHEHVGVFDAFLTPDFWREALDGTVPVTATDGLRPPFKPNRLRASLRSFWGFNQIDTDAAVALPLRDALSPLEARLAALESAGGPGSAGAGAPRLPRDLRPDLRLRPRAALDWDGGVEIEPGEEGHAVFGPYLALPPGRYRLRLAVAAPPRPRRLLSRRRAGEAARFEVALGAAAVVWAAALSELPAPSRRAGGERRVTVAFEASGAPGAAPFEFRVWAAADAALTIRTLRLEAVDGLAGAGGAG